MIRKIRNALISLSDKTEVSKLLKILKKYNVKIISSGGTYKKIKNLGYSCQEISKFTQSPEIQPVWAKVKKGNNKLISNKRFIIVFYLINI